MAQDAGRRRELDSLRGLAAVSVLLYHALALNSKSLSEGLAFREAGGPLIHLLVFSPAHVVWLGAESVWLFFVLSGFVLTRSAMRASFSWTAYYPSRLVRLYLPVVGAIGLAWLTYRVPHTLTPDMDQLLPTSYPLANILRDLTLVGGTTTSLGVLWSLQWEILFSLLLPVYVLLARSRVLVTGVVAAVLCYEGWLHGDAATSFLPMFFVGAAMAQHWGSIERAFGFLTRRTAASHLAGSALVVVGICGLTSFFLLGPAASRAGLPARALSVPVVLAAIALLIVVVQLWPPLRRLLSTGPFVFAGTISFSLYLVHLPLLVLLHFVRGAGGMTAGLSVVVALSAAVAFHYAVERPAHQLSRRVAVRVRESELREAAAGASPVGEQAAPGTADGERPAPELEPAVHDLAHGGRPEPGRAP